MTETADNNDYQKEIYPQTQGAKQKVRSRKHEAS